MDDDNDLFQTARDISVSNRGSIIERPSFGGQDGIHNSKYKIDADEV